MHSIVGFERQSYITAQIKTLINRWILLSVQQTLQFKYNKILINWQWFSNALGHGAAAQRATGANELTLVSE